MPRIYETNDLIDEQYRVERRLKGGMSFVYVAVDTVTGKQFALKALNADDETAESTDANDRFEREAIVWVHLDHHPHIVQALAFLKRTEPPMLLLEYVDGPSLQDVLKRTGRMDERQVVRWARQFCSGMHYVQTKQLPGGQAGTLHRDVKPGNILITSNGTLKITDFGLAKLAASNVRSVTGRFLGTLSYASPEQLHDAKHVEAQSDVFSFGIVLYEMLTGKHPFPADDPTAAIDAIQFREPDWQPVPALLLPIVQRCLQKSSQSRYENFAEVDNELAAVESTLPAPDDAAICATCGFIAPDGLACVVCGTNVPGAAVAGRESHMDATQIAAADESVVDRFADTVVYHCDCGSVLEAGVGFCRDCGRQRPSVQCGRCGSWNPTTNRYCNSCSLQIDAGGES